MSTNQNLDENSLNFFDAKGVLPNLTYNKILETRPEFLNANFFPKFMSLFAEDATTSIMHDSQIFTLPRKENDFFAAYIQDAGTSGSSTKTVKLTDPSFNMFSEGMTVSDPMTNTLAKIIGVRNGELDLQFVSSPTNPLKVFLSTDFANGATLSPRGGWVDLKNRKRVTSGDPFVDFESYQLGMLSLDYEMQATDYRTPTIFTEEGGTKYYAYQRQINKYNEMQAYKMAYNMGDHPGVSAAENGGVPMPRSIVNQIPDSNRYELPENPTKRDIQDYIDHYVVNGNNQSGNLHCVCDQRFITTISRSFENILDNTGKNMIEGFNGLDINYITRMSGLRVSFTVDKSLQNKNIYSASTYNKGIFFDPAVVQTENNGAVAPVFKVHYLHEGYIDWELPGLYDTKGKKATGRHTTDQIGAARMQQDDTTYIIANPKSALMMSGK